MNRFLLLCAILALALLALPPGGASAAPRSNICVWTGSVSTLWDQSDNWAACGAAIPQSADSVVVGPTANPPNIDSTMDNIAVQNFDLQGGGLWIDPTRTLTVNGTFTVDGGDISGNGMIIGALNVQSGKLTAHIILAGPVSVAPSAILEVPAGAILVMQNDLTIQTLGTVQTLSAASIDFSGSTLTNNGAITGQIGFSRTGAQNIAGTGTWDSARLTVKGGSVATLANSLTMGLSTLNVATNGTLALGPQTLTISGTTQVGLTSGTVSGSGKFRTEGQVTIANSTRFTPTLEIGSGTATVNGTVAGPIVVSSGTTLTVPSSAVLSAKNNLTSSGVISGSTLLFLGSTFQNNGQVFNPVFRFEGTAQTLRGSGSFDSGGTVFVHPGAVVGLGSNHQLGKVTIYAGGRMNLNARTLSLSGPGTPLLNQNILTTPGSTIVYNGKTAQTVQVTKVDYYGLTVDNPAGVTLPASETVLTTLTLRNGAFNVGANLKMANMTTIVRENGWLNGTPVFGTKVNVWYNGVGDITTGKEIPLTATVLNNLTNNRLGTVVLAASPTVNGTLNLVRGDIRTGAFVLNMPAAAKVTGTHDVVGSVLRKGPFAANVLYPFNNAWTTLKFALVGTRPTSIKVTLAKSAPSGFARAVKRTYIVTFAGGSRYSATWRMHYDDADLNGNTESLLRLWRYNPVTHTWAALAPTLRNTTTNWIERSGINASAVWTIAQ